MSGKQCRSRLDTVFYGVLSGSKMLALARARPNALCVRCESNLFAQVCASECLGCFRPESELFAKVCVWPNAYGASDLNCCSGLCGTDAWSASDLSLNCLLWSVPVQMPMVRLI